MRMSTTADGAPTLDEHHELASEFIRNREAHERRNALAERARLSSIPPPGAPSRRSPRLVPSAR